jgi:hypothetical protein
MADPLEAIDMLFRLEHGIKKDGGKASASTAAAIMVYANDLREQGWRWDATAHPTVTNADGVHPCNAECAEAVAGRARCNDDHCRRQRGSAGNAGVDTTRGGAA